MFPDTAPRLKAKVDKYILALYSVRQDTDVKLAVSWDFIDEGLRTEYKPQHCVQRISMMCSHGIRWTACQRDRGVLHSRYHWWGGPERIEGCTLIRLSPCGRREIARVVDS